MGGGTNLGPGPVSLPVLVPFCVTRRESLNLSDSLSSLTEHPPCQAHEIAGHETEQCLEKDGGQADASAGLSSGLPPSCSWEASGLLP